MPTFARPALLVAGMLAALLPLALHLVARRPPERAALPTLRFLTPDPRTAIRLRRRPTELLLLALRMLLLVLFGAAAAGPAWLPRQTGTAELVLLDRGGGMAGPAWRSAVEAVRSALLRPGGAPRGDLLVFDTAALRIPARRITPALLDSLASAGPGSAPSDYAAALRALPAAARELRGADSVRVTLLSALRREGWRPGLAHVRRAAWPGSIRVVEAEEGAAGPPALATAAPRRQVVVAASPGEGRYVTAALGATGWEARTDGAAPDSVAAYVLLAPVDARSADGVLAAVRGGATAVVAASAIPAPLRETLPWGVIADRPRSPEPGTLVFDGGLRLAGAERRTVGRPRPGSRLIAAWEDGGPAAAAVRVGRGCLVQLATGLEAGSIALSAEYPLVVDRLVRGCGSGPDPLEGRAPLDAGARSVLRGDELPEAVAVARLGAAGGGVPLGRWVLAAALVLALVETALAYGRRRNA